MKILVVSKRGDGAWYVHLLQKEGHKVQWIVKEPDYADAMLGIVPPPLQRHPSDPSQFDLVVLDSSGMGDLADRIRKHTPTIGGSSFADRLEDDRIFGLEAMEAAKIKVPEWEAFHDRGQAVKFVKSRGKRFVLKPIEADLPDSILKAATYCAKSPDDMVAYIERGLHPKVKSFVLQEFVEGVEISVNAWWTGTEWAFVDHTLEEKKFMNDGLGPNTGCAGNVVWPVLKPNPLFQQGLDRIRPILIDANYVGPIDLNTIVTEGEMYGLEWTPRFGYEGTSNITRLLPIGFGDFLHSIAIGKTPSNLEPRAKFAATVFVSVPPYPSAETSKGKKRVPIKGLNLDHLEQFVTYDVKLSGEDLYAEGHFMGIGCPICTGDSIEEAVKSCYSCIKTLEIPDLQYRTDIQRCVEKRYNQLATWGWLRSI